MQTMCIFAASKPDNNRFMNQYLKNQSVFATAGPDR